VLQLVENEALNSTIAVHEQLVLTQKMATAQALALAGLTKKPRVGSGGAGTVAKRMTKANPNCQGIITAATAAAVGGDGAAAAAGGGGGVGNAPGASAAAAEAASQPAMLDMAPQMLHPSTAKHISPGFDMGLLSQAAAAAASDAVMLSRQQQQARRQGSSSSSMQGYHAGLGGMPQLGDLAGPQAMIAHQQQHHQQLLQQLQQQQQHLAGMTGDPACGWGPAAAPGGFLQQQAAGYAAAAGPPGGAMPVGMAQGPGAAAAAAAAAAGGLSGAPDQQQEAVRAMQLAALQGYLQVSPGPASKQYANRKQTACWMYANRLQTGCKQEANRLQGVGIGWGHAVVCIATDGLVQGAEACTACGTSTRRCDKRLVRL
jgi:hypothetical protein